MDPTSLNRRTDSITCYLTKEQFLFLIYKKKSFQWHFWNIFEMIRANITTNEKLCIERTFCLYWKCLVGSCDKSLVCSTYLLARQAHVVIAALTRQSPFLLLSKFKGGKIRLESNSIKFQSWGKFHPNEIWNYDLCSDWIGSDRV